MKMESISFWKSHGVLFDCTVHQQMMRDWFVMIVFQFSDFFDSVMYVVILKWKKRGETLSPILRCLQCQDYCGTIIVAAIWWVLQASGSGNSGDGDFHSLLLRKGSSSWMGLCDQQQPFSCHKIKTLCVMLEGPTPNIFNHCAVTHRCAMRIWEGSLIESLRHDISPPLAIWCALSIWMMCHDNFSTLVVCCETKKIENLCPTQRLWIWQNLVLSLPPLPWLLSTLSSPPLPWKSPSCLPHSPIYYSATWQLVGATTKNISA